MDELDTTAEDWYRQVLDTAPDALVIVGSDEKIRYVNSQLQKMFGYDAADLIGQSLETLVPERFRSGHSKHVSRFLAHPGTRPMGSGLQLFGRRADGSELAIEVSLSPVRTEEGTLVSAAIRDISERKRTEATAKLASDRLGSAVESMQDAVALFDGGDRLILCNSAYRRLLQDAAPGALVGRRYDEVLDDWLSDLVFATAAEREAFRAAHASGRRAERAAFDVRSNDGRRLRVTNGPTVEGGTVQTVWDLTDDVRLAEELASARVAAEAASAAKSDFLSSMSHELRTPLNAILGFAQLLSRDKKEPLSERQRNRAGEILKGGEHLLRLIDDILDLSRIEAGATSLSIEPVAVEPVLGEIRTTLEPMAARASVELRIDVPADLPMIAVDRTRFAQILMNFGSNAIKYNRATGKVSFAVVRTGTDLLRVIVADTGMGIPADKQALLFQPFQRAGQEAGAIEGTGIGLVITKRLAELMGGSVGFRSTPLEGSEFWVDLPVHAGAKQDEAKAPSAPRASAGLVEGSKHLVLYVEDNGANVLFMKDLLSSFEGCELISVPTAEMGIELARSRPPAVIVMDINLPGMSGLDALRVLRTYPETRDIPVIALTAAASERDRQRGQQVGFYRYLTKPVKVDEFEGALEELLRGDA